MTNRSLVAPIVALHADDTPCTHRQTTTGHPVDPTECTGRSAYTAACRHCPETKRANIRAIVDEFRRWHKCTPSRPAA